MSYNSVLSNWMDGYNLSLKGIKINLGSLYSKQEYLYCNDCLP